MSDALLATVIIAATVIGLVVLVRVMVRSGDFQLFPRFFLIVGGLVVMLVAGLVGVALSDQVSAWLGLDEKADIYVKLGCFIVVFIALAWTFDKLRDWWASRQYDRPD